MSTCGILRSFCFIVIIQTIRESQLYKKDGWCQQYFLFSYYCTVKPVYNGLPWDLKKVAVWKRGLIKLGFKLAVNVSNWRLLTGGRYSQVVVNSGLTVFVKVTICRYVKIATRIWIDCDGSSLIVFRRFCAVDGTVCAIRNVEVFAKQNLVAVRCWSVRSITR